MVKQGTRVLVTGGAGFLGAHVTRALCSAGCQVRVLDDLSTGKKQRLVGLGGGVELLHADVRNPATVERAARGANAIVHLAGTPQADALRAQEVNLGGTLNVLNAARAVERSARPRVVLCGSGAIYGRQQAFVLHEELMPRPSLPQAVMALAAEHYGAVYREAYGVPVNRLRIFRAFGPEEDAERPDASVVARFIRAALDGTSPIIHGDGMQTRDLVYIDNVVQAIVAAIDVDVPEPINVASGEAVAMNFLWMLILELVGKKRMAIDPTYIPAPPWEPKQVRPQIARACQVLNWAPSVRLREGLGRTVQHFQATRSGDPNSWFAPREADEDPKVKTPTRPAGRSRILPPPPPPAAARMRQNTPLPKPRPVVHDTPIPQRAPVSPNGLANAPVIQNAPVSQSALILPVQTSMAVSPHSTPPPIAAHESQVVHHVRYAPPSPDEVEVEPHAIVEDRADERDLEIEWAPVPALPGLGR